MEPVDILADVDGRSRLKSLVEPLLRIPHEYRRFDTTPEAAARDLGIGAPIQQMLIDHGVPHVGGGGDILFDSLDMSTISLSVSARSARRDAMRFWMRSLRRIASGPVAYQVEVRGECPMPRHSGPCVYTVAGALSQAPRVVTDERRGVLLGEITRTITERPELLPPELAELASRYADIDFYYLPTFLSLSAKFVERERIGDCVATAHAIFDAATEAGFEARPAFGFIFSVPYSSPHTWTEVRFGGSWLPVDPLLPKALRYWGISREGEWPVNLSPLGLYHRISAEPIRLAWHGQAPSHAWLPTKVAQ